MSYEKEINQVDQELLNKIGGARLMSLKNAPHLGYSNTHLK